MSELTELPSENWNNASVAAAARLSAFTRARDATNFTPWSTAHPPGSQPAAAPAAEPEPLVIEPAADPRALAFAEGFEEGRRTVELEVAHEREALRALAHALETLAPEPPHELGAMLAETVERLVRQIVGEVALDTHLLAERAANAAALIAEEAAPARMRLHPDDFARLEGAGLPVELVADPGIAPGTVLVESGEGWIEDGPEVGLEKLRIALDKMGVPR